MSNVENLKYLISGERPIPTEDWSLALQVLARLGINAIAITDETTADRIIAAGIEAIPAGTIPYELDEITSREQYLGNEHLAQFWPEYRKTADRPGSRGGSLSLGLNMLTHPQPRGRTYGFSVAQAGYAEKLGIKIVKPRSLVGFSDEYAPTAYSRLWDKEGGNSVIEVGSFIDSARLVAALPTSERPRGILKHSVRFFVALADKLEAQIEAAK